MLVKRAKGSKYWQVLFLIGIITVIFGIVFYNAVTIEGRNISMLKGMIIGLGSAFTAIAAVKLIQNKMTPADKLKAQEIELKDERNIGVLRIAYSVASVSATILFALLGFIFVAMDFIVPALMSIAAMYLQLLTFFIAYKYYNSKM